MCDRYPGEFILLQDNEVRWHDSLSDLTESRRIMAGSNPLSGMWFKYVDPEKVEGEHYEVYEKALGAL